MPTRFTEINTEKRSPFKIKTVWGAHRLFSLFLIIIVVLSIATSFYFYKKYSVLKNDPNAEIRKETENLVEALGKLMDLPKGEVPTLVTVLDKTKLSNEIFFKNAENGDKVLVYITSMKAIMYRPSTGKIIEVGPIFLNDNATPTIEKINTGNSTSSRK